MKYLNPAPGSGRQLVSRCWWVWAIFIVSAFTAAIWWGPSGWDSTRPPSQEYGDFLKLRRYCSLVFSQGRCVRFLSAALMGCYYGMNSARGAMGVGRATRDSVCGGRRCESWLPIFIS